MPFELIKRVVFLRNLNFDGIIQPIYSVLLYIGHFEIIVVTIFLSFLEVFSYIVLKYFQNFFVPFGVKHQL